MSEGAFAFLVSLGTTDPARGSRLTPRADSPRRIAERRAVRLAKRKQTQRLLAGLLPPGTTPASAPPRPKRTTEPALAAAAARFAALPAARADALRRDPE